MRAIVCSEFGPPGLLRVEDRPEPVPGPGEVLVRHRAWGLSHVDVLMCGGGYQLRPDLPFVPGLEAAGDVVANGPGAARFRPGDRVITGARPGTFAELCALPEARVHPLPRGFDHAEGAAFRSAYATAWNALCHGARIEPGEVLLVLGAAGGVGLAAVHVGRLLGAIVIAAAGSEAKRAELARQGADHVIDYTGGFRDEVKALTGGRGADVILDPVGGRAAEESLRAMNWGCRIVYLGFAGGAPVSVRSNLLLIKGASAIGFRAGEIGRRKPGLNERTMATLIRLAEAGRLRPHISHRARWPDIAAAIQPIIDREVIGRVVMEA